MKDKKIYKPKSITGFPEWLPEERIVEQRWFDSIRRVFESYGYCSIETPSVEEIDVLAAKGEVDKEIYVIERLHKDENSKSEARLALHFDQTVPLARYVAQHFNELVFPFKRYQMQRVWRGERPQMGRMREFYQCDIDVINVDSLPISFDAEVAAVCYEAIQSLDIGRVQLRISNRKILIGYLQGKGVVDFMEILRIIDKLEKVGIEEIRQNLLKTEAKEFTEQLLELCCLRTSSFEELENRLRAILDLDYNGFFESNISSLMDEGVQDLTSVLSSLSHLGEGVVADLSIVRGLDYYTGTVYETQLLDVPQFTGSVCSGGRYDDLASGYINKHLPGVGISIGFSRLFDVMRQTAPEKLGIEAKSPTDVLVLVPNEERHAEALEVGRQLRTRNRVEVYHAAQKEDKQFKYADKKKIPYIWFLPANPGEPHYVRQLGGGKEIADPNTWERPKA